MQYMLDTNICIHLIQQQPPHLIQRLAKMAYGEAVLSSVVLAELQYGVERHAEIEDRAQAGAALNALLTLFPVLSFDEAAATSYGILRAALPDRRRDALDRLIAAHAISRRLVLVTNNDDDFVGYPALVIENWVRAH